MDKKAAQKGFAPVALLLVGGVIILIVGVLIASGTLKFSASVSKTSPEANVTKQAEPEVKKVELSETYTNTDVGYSLKYPNGWKTDTLKDNAVIYSTDLGAKSYNETIAGIIIFSTTLSGKMKEANWETQVEIMKLQLEKDYPGATFTTDSETKIGDLTAHVYNYTYPNSKNTFQSKFFMVVSADRLYGLMATAIEQRWNKYEPVLSEVVNSFKLL